MIVGVGLPMPGAIVERPWLKRTWTGQFPMHCLHEAFAGKNKKGRLTFRHYAFRACAEFS